MQSGIQTHRIKNTKWSFIAYILLIIHIVLCAGVLFLDLSLDNMESTKLYIGFFQALIGIALGLICILAVYFHFKTFVIFYIVCSIILNLACGIMFILIELSEDIQYYNADEAPLTPAHTKKWFRLFKAYFILSLTLASYSIVMTICLCKLSSLFSNPRSRKPSEVTPFPALKSIGTNNTNNSDERPQQSVFVPNCFDLEKDKEAYKCEFQKPLLLKDCLISFEPHKGIESTHSLKSGGINYEIDSMENENPLIHYSFPPGQFMEKEEKIYKNSDNLRSVERWKETSDVLKKSKRIKKG